MPILTYKYRLYPNKTQQATIDQTIETCRRLYNYFLDDRIYTYKEGGWSPSRIEQQNQLPLMKQKNPYMQAVYSSVLQDVTFRINRAYDNFFRRVKQGKEKAGFPKFKSRRDYDSFTYPSYWGIKLLENNRLSLSKIGEIKIDLHRPLDGTIKICTVIRKNGKYYASLTCEIEETVIEHTGKNVGIDVGISNYVTTSDGEFFPKLDAYRKAEKHLKFLHRQVSRRTKGSARRRKAVELLAKAYEKVTNQRKYIAHVVSRKLVNNYDMIAHEDLSIASMVKDNRLSKSIHDASWGMLFGFLKYKAESAGKEVIPVNPAYTSQICSSCGEMVKKKLSQRQHICPKCGLNIDRDLNAAINILNAALKVKESK